MFEVDRIKEVEGNRDALLYIIAERKKFIEQKKKQLEARKKNGAAAPPALGPLPSLTPPPQNQSSPGRRSSVKRLTTAGTSPPQRNATPKGAKVTSPTTGSDKSSTAQPSPTLSTPVLAPPPSGPPQTTTSGGGGGVSGADLVNQLLNSVRTAVNDGQPLTAPMMTQATSKKPEDDSPTDDDAATQFVKKLKAAVGTSASLTYVKQHEVAILPLAPETFEKSAQTDEAAETDSKKEPSPKRDSIVKAEDLYITNKRRGLSALQSAAKTALDSVRLGLTPGKTNLTDGSVDGIVVPPHVTPGSVTPRLPSVMTEDETKKIVSSLSFATFFDATTKVVERTLGSSDVYDLIADYAKNRDEEDPGEMAAESVKKGNHYQDTKYAPGRPVTALRVSPEFNELFLTAYGAKTDASISDPDGVVLVWNWAMPKRPEYVFTCQSAICTAQFDPYRPNIVIGGTFSGSVVIWDTRAKTRPVQRSAHSAKGHLHSVFSMDVVGTQHAHNLVSVDCDGKLCLWSLSMLVNPTETVDLKKKNKDASASVLAIGFAENETNTLYGGVIDGSLVQAQIHGSKTGVTESHEEAHSGPVTSLHWRKSIEGQQADFTDLMLSTSLDWTVKLWRPKSQSSPVYSFDVAEDYVLDAKWHPTRPSLFAASAADGVVDFWDINQDTEVPVVRLQAGTTGVGQICWSSDGRKFLAGDDSGMTTMYGIAPNLSTAKADDYQRMATQLEEMKSEQSPKSVS